MFQTCNTNVRKLTVFLNRVNKANLVHNFSLYVCFFSLHVSGDYVHIIGINNCIFATLLSQLFLLMMGT
jgi:hypothetical protein